MLAYLLLWTAAPQPRLLAAVAIGLLHLLIDAVRTAIERATIGRGRKLFLKRMDVARWLTGRASYEIDSYMRESYLGWFLLNIGDQGAHLATIVMVALMFASGNTPFLQ